MTTDRHVEPHPTGLGDVVVVGLGSPDRGDDAVGPAVARQVGVLAPAGAVVVVHEDPTALVHLLDGATVAVVVDAIVSGITPGAITVLEVGRGDAALPATAWEAAGRGGTHAFGVAAAVELARALGVLPSRVVLVGVEAARFDHGAAMTEAVRAAVPVAAARIADILTGAAVTGGA